MLLLYSDMADKDYIPIILSPKHTIFCSKLGMLTYIECIFIYIGKRYKM